MNLSGAQTCTRIEQHIVHTNPSDAPDSFRLRRTSGLPAPIRVSPRPPARTTAVTESLCRAQDQASQNAAAESGGGGPQGVRKRGPLERDPTPLGVRCQAPHPFTCHVPRQVDERDLTPRHSQGWSPNLDGSKALDGSSN